MPANPASATGTRARFAAKSRRNVRTGPLLAPAVILLLLWMIVPLAMTLWFSFQYYNLINPFITGFAGFSNYSFLLSDPTYGRQSPRRSSLSCLFW